MEPFEQRARRCVRSTLAILVLAVVLLVGMGAVMATVDGQARSVQHDLDDGRLRQYGVVTP